MRKIKPILVPIDSITANRELHPSEDITGLIEAVRKFPGLKFPVLIDKESSLLLDGLRRIKAMEALGYTEVPALRMDMFEEVCEMTGRVHAHGVEARPHNSPLQFLRAYQFYNDTEALRRERTNRARRRPHADRSAGPTQRDYLMQAFAPMREAELAAALSVYRRFDTETDPALKEFHMDLRNKLEMGELTIYQARFRVVDPDPTKMDGPVISIAEQRRVIASAIDQLAGTNAGLRGLGELHEEMNPYEVRAYIQALERERNRLLTTIRSLKKRVEGK